MLGALSPGRASHLQRAQLLNSYQQLLGDVPGKFQSNTKLLRRSRPNRAWRHAASAAEEEGWPLALGGAQDCEQSSSAACDSGLASAELFYDAEAAVDEESTTCPPQGAAGRSSRDGQRWAVASAAAARPDPPCLLGSLGGSSSSWSSRTAGEIRAPPGLELNRQGRGRASYRPAGNGVDPASKTHRAAKQDAPRGPMLGRRGERGQGRGQGAPQCSEELRASDELLGPPGGRQAPVPPSRAAPHVPAGVRCPAELREQLESLLYVIAFVPAASIAALEVRRACVAQLSERLTKLPDLSGQGGPGEQLRQHVAEVLLGAMVETRDMELWRGCAKAMQQVLGPAEVPSSRH